MAVRCKAPARKNAFNRLELTTPDGARRFCIASGDHRIIALIFESAVSAGGTRTEQVRERRP